MMPEITDSINKTNAFYCLECGKCTAACPISLVNSSYSPRSIVGHALLNPEEETLSDPLRWACLTCKACEDICPVSVDYSTLMLELRVKGMEYGQHGLCSHGGALQSLMRIMTDLEFKQNRMDWIDDDLKIAEKGDYLFFVGCAPYLDVFFADLGAATLDAAKGVIRTLNVLGIEPVVLPDERCCGHDLLWSGDEENFKRLAENNLELIKNAGAKTVIFSCAECYRAFKHDYEDNFGPLDFETVHITEIVAQKMADNMPLFSTNNRQTTVTYHDPCRLGRHLGVYDAPREVVKTLPGVELQEMAKSGKNALCCGVSNWMNCTVYSKQIQVERLQQAKDSGADIMLTACPKCEIHLRCAMKDPHLKDELTIELKDVATLTAESISTVKSETASKVQ